MNPPVNFRQATLEELLALDSQRMREDLEYEQVLWEQRDREESSEN